MTRNSLVGLVVFVLVAYGGSWAGWWLVGDEQLSLWLFPLFASIAGFVAAFAEGGVRGLAGFSRRVFRVRGAMLYVLAALLIPPLLGVAYLLATGVSPWQGGISPAAVLGLSLGAALVTGPLAEEFGWRGYLQHTLLRSLAPFWTAILVGLFWWAWHYALYRDSIFTSPSSALRFLAYLQAWSIFLVFLVERARGSVWPAVALHWAANTHPGVLQALFPGVDGGALPGGSKGWLFYLAAAGLFVLVNRRFFFSKRLVSPARNAEPGVAAIS